MTGNRTPFTRDSHSGVGRGLKVVPTPNHTPQNRNHSIQAEELVSDRGLAVVL